MTPFQKKAILELAKALKRYDDSNPDVGMGPSFWMFVKDAAKKLDMELSTEEAIKISKG